MKSTVRIKGLIYQTHNVQLIKYPQQGQRLTVTLSTWEDHAGTRGELRPAAH